MCSIAWGDFPIGAEVGSLFSVEHAGSSMGAVAAMDAPVVASRNAARYAEATPEARLEAIEQLAALLCGTHAELLDLIAAAMACGDWELDGATGPAPWLVGRLGLVRQSADEWIRVAGALQYLPALRDAYASGELAWDQVRLATKFVTPDDDADQAVRLPGHSAAQIALMARQARPVEDHDANAAHADRSFRWRRDHRRGGFVYGGFVPFDQGEAINMALDSSAERCGVDPTTDTWAPISVRRADALHALATQKLGSSSAPDRATVVIHADVDILDGRAPGNGFIADLAVCRSGVLRSLCDARVEVALHGPHGATVGVARASQQIPWWLRRQVHGRDVNCRGFGCGRRIRQVHHITHWADGGETNLDNLVGLCWEHHRLVHEGGWSIVGEPNDEITFISPDGRRRLPCRPRPRRPDLEPRRVLGRNDPDPP
jgi:hypothetical protein